MEEFDIDEIREAIKNLSYEDKLDYLEDKESDLASEIERLESEIEELESDKDKLEGYNTEISSLEAKLRNEHNDGICRSIFQALQDSGYNFKPDSNGNISFSFGIATFSILMSFQYDSIVKFLFTADKRQHSIQDIVCSILPDFKKDINSFSRQVPEEDISTCVVDVVGKLMDNKRRFEELGED